MGELRRYRLERVLHARVPARRLFLKKLAPAAGFFLALLTLLLAEPRLDFRARSAGFRYFEPVARGLALRRGQYADYVAVLKLLVHRRYAPVYHRAHAFVPNLRVYRVGEIYRGRAVRHRDDLALWREDENVARKHVRLEVVHELRAGRRFVAVAPLRRGFERLAYPRESLVEVVDLLPALLVVPVGGDSVLGEEVHLLRPYLHLERVSVRTDDGGVQRLVHVALRIRYVVVEKPRYRLPYRVDEAEHLIALADGLDYDAQRKKVVELLQRKVLAAHLFVDAVEMLRASLYRGLDALLPQLVREDVHRLFYYHLALGQLFAHATLDVVVHLWVEYSEGKVFELALDLIYSETVRERRVYFKRLARYRKLLLAAVGRNSAHIVQAVRKLDEDNADIFRHDDEHLAQVLSLVFLDRLELELSELRHPVDERHDILAETLLELLAGKAGVFEHVVEQRGDYRFAVHLHAREYRGYADGVDYVRLAGVAALAAVRLGGEDECLADRLHVLLRHVERGLAPQVLPREAERRDALVLRYAPPVAFHKGAVFLFADGKSSGAAYFGKMSRPDVDGAAFLFFAHCRPPSFIRFLILSLPFFQERTEAT